MKPHALPRPLRQHGVLRGHRAQACATGVLALALFSLSPAIRAQDQSPGAAAALQARRIALEPQLRANAFGQPLQLSSHQGSAHVEGDVHAEVDTPFPDIAATLTSATGLCELLLLHLNVRACWPANAAGGQVLMLTVAVPSARARRARTTAWFALTERYPEQLHELDLDDYLQEKHDDLAGQASHAP